MVLSRTRSLDRLLLQVVDGALAGVILLVPFLMGGRHAIGQLALTVLAVAAAWAWAARQCLREDAGWRPTWATPLLLAGLALVALQTIPLPPAWLARLSPHTADLLPLWNTTAAPAVAMGSWSYLSFTPADTLAGLVLFLDSALLFFVAVQRIRSVEDIEQLLRWCAVSAVCMAVFGMVQLLTSNGKFFWFYEHPFSQTSQAAKGSFTNRNHFAQFLALGIGPLIWWLQDVLHRRKTPERKKDPYSHALPNNHVDPHHSELKTYLLGLGLGVVFFAGLLSLSRGGMMAMLAAAAVCTVIAYWTGSINGRFTAALGAVGLLIGVSLAIFGYDRVSNRLEDLSSGSLERLDREAGRRNIWAATLKAIPDYLLVGAGEGSFREVYPMYTDALPDEGIEFTYAENSYLHRTLETGVVGLALTLAGMALCAVACIGGIRASNPTRVRAATAAIAASLTAIAVHAAVDFVWYVPACMAIVALLAACVLRIQQLPNKASKEEQSRKNRERRPLGTAAGLSFFAPRFAWLLCTVLLTLLGGWMIGNRVGPAFAQPYWEEYQRARKLVQVQTPAALTGAEADVQTQEQWIVCLENVVRWEPTHLRAHLALAETHRRLFEKLQTTGPNPMSLTNVRDAAIQSQFGSREALVEWLLRAVGKHWVHLERALQHTRQAIRLCPLEGRAYVYLADLSFLSGGNGAAKLACVEQALRVRPYDGAVLYAAGTEALLAGDVAQWLDYAKQAFRSSRRQQQQLIGDLVASTPKEQLPVLIDFVLREFQPDLWALRCLHGLCASQCAPTELAVLIRRRAEQAETEAPALDGPSSARVWLEAQQLYGQLGERDEALRCARQALERDSGNYDVHYQLALCLLNQQSYGEAEPHLRWCLQRSPGNQTVERQLRNALKGRLDGPRRAAVDGPRGTAAETHRVIAR